MSAELCLIALNRALLDQKGGVEGLAKLVRIDRFWDRGLPSPGAPDGDKDAFPDGPKPDDPLGIAYRKVSDGKRRALHAGDTHERVVSRDRSRPSRTIRLPWVE